MSYETFQFSISDHIARLTLCRPDANNALNLKMAQELLEASIICTTDKRVRCLIITGDGKMFCPGGDLKEMNAQGENKPAHLSKMAIHLHDTLVRMAHMNAPVVIAVNGTAAGAGFSMVLSGDYVIASDKAKFVSAYTASGLTPDGSSTYYLAKQVGLLRAKELMMTNRVLTAREALEWGIINQVVAPDELTSKAEQIASQFAQGPTQAFGGVKRMLLGAFSQPLETQLDTETRTIASMMHTHDGPHGLASFLEKKTPTYKGE
ncbi:MAG: enoyl-CoA hydratase/isomerase family protein [Burkholderiaceae bacterium]